MILAAELGADAIDLAFVTRPADPDDDGLQLRVVSTEPLVAILAPDQRLASRKRVSVPLLAGETIVTFPKGATIRGRLEDAAARAGYTPRVAFETNEVGRMRALAAAGLAIAVLPRSDAERCGPPITAVPSRNPSSSTSSMWRPEPRGTTHPPRRRSSTSRRPQRASRTRLTGRVREHGRVLV